MVVLTGLLLAALLLASCGDGGVAQPTPTPTPEATEESPTMRLEVTARRLTYVGADGALWLVNADGTGRKRLADVCFREGRSGLSDLVWSPAGDKLAASCLGPISYTDDSLMVLDEEGALLAEIRGETQSPRWSPDGQRLAYEHWSYVGGGYPTVGAPLLQEMGILDLATLKTTTLAEHVHLLAWPLPDRILVGLNAEYGNDALVYDASWLDPDTGRTEPLPRLDNDVSVWLTPDAKKAVVTASRLVDASKGGIPLSIYDLGTGRETPIPLSVAGVTFEGTGAEIRPEWLTISGDGSMLYWVHGSEAAGVSPRPLDVYRANMDGSGLVKLEPLPPSDFLGLDLCRFGLALSGDSLAAIYQGDCPSAGKIIVQDMETSARVEVGEGFGIVAWQPPLPATP